MANKQSCFHHLTSYNYSVEQQMHAFCILLNHYSLCIIKSMIKIIIIIQLASNLMRNILAYMFNYLKLVQCIHLQDQRN